VNRIFNLNWLLVLIPITILLDKNGASPLVIFFVSALSIIPLSKMIGESTEAIAYYLGPTVGGLMNASLGNAPEIIIGYFALKEGLVDMVKASITGSIIGNLLIGLGLTFLAVGTKTKGRFITFDLASYRVHNGLLTLGIFGLIIPDVFDFTTDTEREISLEISIILLVVYILSVAATFLPKTPDSDTDDALELLRIDKDHPEEPPKWSRNKAFLILTVVTIALADMSETMTGSVTPATAQIGLTPLFVGVFLLALLGNASELINGVRFARNDQLELSLGIFLGGGAQMALLVAPALVLLGIYHGQNMNLLFSKYELVALIMTVIAVTSFLSSGRVKPGVGVAFMTLYIMLGVGFFYAP
jgi:Ca2+:H+ antiporter